MKKKNFEHNFIHYVEHNFIYYECICKAKLVQFFF